MGSLYGALLRSLGHRCAAKHNMASQTATPGGGEGVRGWGGSGRRAFMRGAAARAALPSQRSAGRYF